MATKLTDLFGQTFSTSTTAYTLALTTKVPNKENTGLNDLFVILGRIQSFAPNQSKTLEKIWEINTASGGEAVEIIPGGIPTDEISIDRIEIYPITFLNAFGGFESNNLRGQNFPFTITEIIFDPKDVKQTMLIEYINCFLADFSDPIDISDGGGGPVTVSGTVQVSYRRARRLFDQNFDANVDNLYASEWLSFKPYLKEAREGNPGYSEHRLNDLGIQNDFVILNRTDLAVLANVCVDAAPTTTQLPTPTTTAI